MSADAKLVLQNITKSFGDTLAVAGLSILLAKGEFLSLLGPSGCGKSTTLSMIAGFEAPDSGDILVDGKRVNDIPPQERGVGIVFQDYAVFGKLTVRENLGFGLEATGVPRALRKKSVEEMASQREEARKNAQAADKGKMTQNA